jgi:hypothetical protein
MHQMAIVKMLVALATALVGVIALVWPNRITGFTGLAAPGARGITEIRVVLGGFFIALGILPVLFNASDMYLMLGFTYLIAGIIRLVTMFLDGSVERSNIISTVVELVFGVLLVL